MLSRLPEDAQSPEARLARAAYDDVAARPLQHLMSCASGRELDAKGFGDDVAIAGRLHTSEVVPLLTDGAFPGQPGVSGR